jgi:hypothetical protein
MAIADWMRVIDAVSGIAQVSGKLRQKAGGDPSSPAPQEPGAPGTLEARMAGVVVAALKEAFDRDRARMDLERAQVESERRRAEEALNAELRRQSVERALAQLRTIALMAIAAWMLSAVLAAWLPGMRAGVARALLGTGWALAFVTIGCAFAASQQASTWTTGPAPGAEAPRSAAASAAPWALLLGLAAIAASLLTAL